MIWTMAVMEEFLKDLGLVDEVEELYSKEEIMDFLEQDHPLIGIECKYHFNN